MAEKRSASSELLRFFIPMGLTASLMMFTHSIVSAGLSRTLNPVVSTAAYAVALSMSDLAGGPLCQIRQTAIALVSSEQSFQSVRRVYMTAMAVMSVILLAIAYVPFFSQLVIQQILGVKDELFAPTLKAFRVIMFLPLFSGLRYLYHGVITAQKETRYITAGMFFRVGWMIAFIFTISRWQLVTGPLVGALTLVTGVGLECLMAYIYGRKLIPTGDTIVRDTDAWRFYLPLIASALIFGIGKPFINAGLARMPNATISLAAYSVASSLSWVIVAPSQTIHMLTMVFGRESERLPMVRRFATGFSLLSTGVIVLMAYSPIGNWVLADLVQVPSQTLPYTLQAIRTLAFFPLIICWQEYNMGLLLISRSTRMVSISRAINLTATILFVLFIAPMLPGTVAAPLAQMVGYAFDGAILQGSRWLEGRRSRPTATAA